MVGPGTLASLLTELVDSSGSGPTWIALKAGVGVLALRRYCRGEAIPPTVNDLESIGIACGAAEPILDELVRRWVRQRGPLPVDRRAERAARRARELPGFDTAPYRLSFTDPEMFTRYADAIVPGSYESDPRSRIDLLSIGELHPDDAIVARAQAIRRHDREQPAGGRGVGLAGPEVAAAHRRLAGLADDGWIAGWVAWGNAAGPADRDRVEAGIRRCYELSGVRWHGQVVWVESPFAGALRRRLLADTARRDDLPAWLAPFPGAEHPPMPGRMLWRTYEGTRDVEAIPNCFDDDLR